MSNVRLYMLSKIEDGILVICEGEPVTLTLARTSLSAWFDIKFKKSNIKQAALRLARLKLVKWHYYASGKPKMGYRLKPNHYRITLKATPLGEEYLFKARAAA